LTLNCNVMDKAMFHARPILLAKPSGAGPSLAKHGGGMTYDLDRERHVVLAREVIRNEARALEEVAAGIGTEFVDAVEMIARSEGRVITCGVGKSGHVALKIASTLSSTGTPASFVNANEAVHGDLGGLSKGDVVIAVSHSGENPEIIAVLPMFRRFDVQVIAITDNPDSTLSLVSNIVLVPGPTSRADPIGLAPTASSVAAMALGDAIALAVAQHRGLSATDFEHHPGGAIGQLMESIYTKRAA
jgi:arabinose-5-phosphate isomerase